MLRPSRREILVLVRQGLCELCSFQVVELALEIAGERRGVVVGVVEDARGGIRGRVPPRFAEAGVILVELGVEWPPARLTARASCASRAAIAAAVRVCRGRSRGAGGSREETSSRERPGRRRRGTLRRLGRRAPETPPEAPHVPGEATPPARGATEDATRAP